MADVFISYASDDRERIKPIVETIEQAGFSVWWDRKIGLGRSFEREIERELESARCVVVIWSARSVESDWVRNEAQEGLDRGVLLPILIDEVRPPLAFRRAQAAQLVGRVSNDELNRVVTSIESIVTGVTASGLVRREGYSPRISRWPQYLSGITATAILIAASYWWVGRDDSDKGKRPMAASTESSLTVLPFANLSTEPDMEFFSEGITREISSTLGRNPNIVIRQSPSSLELKNSDLGLPEIGRRLGVTHILDGGVQRSAARVRITVQLVNVITEQTIWSDQFNLEMTDIFEVQDQIARQIFHALNLQLTVRPQAQYAVGMEAYDAFLRGMNYSRTGDNELAEEWYQKAEALDPTNPDLWAERARNLDAQMWFGAIPNTGSLRDRRNEYIKRALEIDPSHWARARMAVSTFMEGRQYQRAVDELIETVADHPNSWDAVMYLTFALGAIDRKSDAYYKAARRFSLLSREHSAEQQMLIASCRLEEARQSIASNPNYATGYHAARLAAIEGDLDGLEAHLNRLSDSISPFYRTFFKALHSYLKNDFEEARKIISSEKRVTGYQPFLHKHLIALIERDLDAAVSYYAKAVDAAEPAAMFWHNDTCFLNRIFPDLVAYPPYQKTLRDIGLDAESTAKIQIPDLPF